MNILGTKFLVLIAHVGQFSSVLIKWTMGSDDGCKKSPSILQHVE